MWLYLIHVRRYYCFFFARLDTNDSTRVASLTLVALIDVSFSTFNSCKHEKIHDDLLYRYFLRVSVETNRGKDFDVFRSHRTTGLDL